jgi:hypothetical protein
VFFRFVPTEVGPGCLKSLTLYRVSHGPTKNASNISLYHCHYYYTTTIIYIIYIIGRDSRDNNKPPLVFNYFLGVPTLATRLGQKP